MKQVCRFDSLRAACASLACRPSSAHRPTSTLPHRNAQVAARGSISSWRSFDSRAHARSSKEPRRRSISSWRSFDSRAHARSPKEPRRPMKQGLRLFVCMRFQDLFHSPSGVLFAFPSRYWCTIGRSRVFSLGGWSPHLQTGLHVSRPTCRTLSSTSDFSRTGLSPTVAALSRAFR
jgi:hypothetical protein